jgi:hypothetical protein
MLKVRADREGEFDDPGSVQDLMSAPVTKLMSRTELPDGPACKRSHDGMMNMTAALVRGRVLALASDSRLDMAENVCCAPMMKPAASSVIMIRAPLQQIAQELSADRHAHANAGDLLLPTTATFD